MYRRRSSPISALASYICPTVNSNIGHLTLAFVTPFVRHLKCHKDTRTNGNTLVNVSVLSSSDISTFLSLYPVSNNGLSKNERGPGGRRGGRAGRGGGAPGGGRGRGPEGGRGPTRRV